MIVWANICEFISLLFGFLSSLVLLVTPFKARKFKAVVDYSMKPVLPKVLKDVAAADMQAADGDLRAISRLEPRYLYAGALLLLLSFVFAMVRFAIVTFGAPPVGGG